MLKLNIDSNGIFSSLWIKVIITALILIILILIFIIPLRIPYSVKVPGKILPSEEYIVMKGRGGQLITLLKDYKNGVTKNYTVNEFQRGDNASFSFSSDIKPGYLVFKKDTIGSIFSNELEVRLSTLRGQLDVTNQLLNSTVSGQKESLIQEARENLNYARKRCEVDKKIYSRNERLYQKGLISEQTFDSSKYTVELSELACAIAEAQLQTMRTGEKEEQIEYIKSQVSALKNQIDVLEKRLSNFNFISPINGYVSEMLKGDTLLILSDTSEFVISMPVPIIEKNYVLAESSVEVISSINGMNAVAKLKRIKNYVQYYLSKPVVYAIAILDFSNDGIMPGLIVECKIDCGPVDIDEYLKRIFNFKLF